MGVTQSSIGALISIAVIVAASGVQAQGPAPAPVSPAASTSSSQEGAVQTQDFRLPIQIAGRSFDLEARLSRPAGTGPFPLVVINHGTPVSIREAPSEKLGFTKAAQWFASQGYAVVVAMRPGFGSSDGPYLETSGPCSDRDYVRDGRLTAAVEIAIVQAASSLPAIDRRRIVVVGQSAGGFGVIALADEPPAGVLGVISFAGGRGGDDHENICSGEQRLIDAAGVFGRLNHLPQLWLFAANDHFFPPRLGRAMFQAYKGGSGQTLKFVDLPAFDDDGHRTFGHADPSVWAASVSAFMRQVGASPGVK